MGILIKGKNMRTRQSFHRRLPLLASLSVLMAAGVLASNGAVAQSARIPRAALPTGFASQPLAIGSSTVRSPQVIAGSFDPYRVSGNTATITQREPSGILRWESFDIGADARVDIVQPSSTAVLLNKVDGGISPTVIEGILKANGQVYIYNPNGILFGKTANINTNTLVATSLKIDDKRFLAGILAPNLDPIFAADAALAADPGAVVVEGDASQKATLTAERGGKIMLMAPNVTNNGVLSAPDGQVVLAAGGKVFLAAPSGSDPGMRGLLVEVNSDNLKAAAGGTATNDTYGQISVERGNATMVGLAVNQMGTVSATTSINLNGSIYLRARDGAKKDGEDQVAFAEKGGKLTLGQGSLTEVAVYDDQGKAAAGPDDPVFKKSRVDLSGQYIVLQDNARILAQGGDVTIVARENPHLHDMPLTAKNSRVDFGAGSLIDVSGGTDTKLAMESNVIEVQLLSELADNVLMRNSPLRGKKVRFDIRKGTRIADISKAIAKLEGGVGERTAAGGTVSVSSEGEIIQRRNSRIDVSGGSIDYLSGYVNTTKLTANGALFDVSTASPDVIYDGIVDLTFNRRNYEFGYTVGKDAGSVQFSAPAIVMQGDLQGATTIGQHQREVGGAARALGGKLIIGSGEVAALSAAASEVAGYHGKLVFGGSVTKGAIPPGVNEAFDSLNNPDHALLFERLDIDTAALSQAGFSRLSATTSGDIDIVAPLALTAGGEVAMGAVGKIDFKAGASMPGGSLTARALGAMKVADGTAFDLAGTWSNDSAMANPTRDAAGNPVGNVILKGGKLDLTGGQLVVGNNVSADVSGGAWLDASNKLKKGDGGSISMKARVADGATIEDTFLRLGNNLALSAYSMAKGGKLSLQGRNVTVGGADSGQPLDLWLTGKFFELGGFTNYDIGALGNFTVSPGSEITPRALSWQFSSLNSYRSTKSGAMRDVAAPTMLDLVGPAGGRTPTSVTFRALERVEPNAGQLLFGANALLRTDPGASVTLLAGQQLTVNGTIDTPGGKIAIGLTPYPADVLYSDGRSIWFGSNASLSAKGSTDLFYTDESGMTTGEALDGGSIQVGRVEDDGRLNPVNGYVVAERGASFDVSGAESGPVSFRYGRFITAPQRIASAGGSIDIRAREGLLFAGTLNGKAGGAGAQGGALSLALDRENLAPTGYPTAQSIFTLTAGAPQWMIPNGVLPGQSIPDLEGAAWVATGSFAGGGFDRIKLRSQDELAFSLAGGPLALDARASLILDAQRFSATGAGVAAGAASRVQLNSAYVQLGNADYRNQNSGASSAGKATLDVNATTIDLIGSSALQGFGAANLAAVEDIRLVGVTKVDVSKTPSTKPDAAVLRSTGELNIAGDLNLSAAQIYPTTLSTFMLNAEGSDSKLTFASNGKTMQAPLAAGGNLIGKAAHIVQGGRVVAPFGGIRLEASKDLVYAAGSVTSVAGEGLIPFGRVENGRDWVYDFGNGNAVAFKLNPGTDGNLVENALPQKSIVSKAPDIITQAGATLDLSGGGDLYAYEFTPGPNGSRDVLTSPDTKTSNKVFAINPNFTASVAPRDWQYGQDGGLLPGDSIHLSGIDGLAAGTYTLLPAHYALLPGGFSVTLATGTRDMPAGSSVTNLDGSMTIAGRRTVLGAGDPRTSGWLVSSGSVVRTRSEYQEYKAGSFFSDLAARAGVDAPMLPGDAGRVAFDATNTLTLDGLVRLGAVPGGRRGSADISAPEIEVVADVAQPVAGNALKLTAEALNALGAESLLLGGLRDSQADGTHLTVGANTVTLRNDSAHALSGSEIILAARDKVLVDTGAAITGEGSLSRAPGNLLVNNTDTSGKTVGTDGALLRISGGAPVSVTRVAPARVGGVLDIRRGATVTATGSAYLDATLNSKLDGSLNLASGAALGLGSGRISLGNDIPAAVEGLHFDGAELASLSKLSALELNSYSTIDLYGKVNLGDSAMQTLTLKGAGIQGYGSAGGPGMRQASLTAQTIRFEGSANAIAATAQPALPATVLTVQARDIEFGSDAFAIKGYADTQLRATREARATGTGAFSTEHDFTLAAGRIVANGGADVSIQTAERPVGDSRPRGKLTLTQVANAEAPGATPLGGRLRFKGDSIYSDARIVAPAGQVEMVADNGINVAGGEINAGGAAIAFGSTTAYAPGGRISLDSRQGDISVGAAATLDVSSTAAAAGTLSVKASAGAANIAGNLRGGAAAAADGVLPSQGNFAMDVARIDDNQFDVLNAKLNSGGFTESRVFRVRQDDVTLSAGQTIKAHETVIATDNGSITIGGTIDASGVKGGSIELYASQATAAGNSGNVTLNNGAVLLANATVAASTAAGSTGDGGRVLIGTGSADGKMPVLASGGSNIRLNAGSHIDVSGNGAGRNGSVTLRAPKVGTTAIGTDVAIARFDATIAGSAETVIEAYKTYTTTKISEAADKKNADGTYSNLQAATTAGAPAGVMYTEAKSFSDSNAAKIATRLGRTDASVRAGIEVRSTGNLEISVNENSTTRQNRGWNLNAWRFNDAPGILSLRAAGDLIVKGSISDGFVKPTTTLSMPNWTLDNKASWSYRLSGGADMAAANPLAVKSGLANGDVKIQFARSGSATDQSVAMVRTGTGRIDVAAGNDVVLDFINNVGATIYTAGMHKDTQGEFNAPRNQANTMYGALAQNPPDTKGTLAEFADNGGAITVYAGSDVVGAPVPQLINNWLFRQGRSEVDGSGNTVFEKTATGTLNTAWWSRFDYFNQGIATFAGGDISVVAATGNVKDFSASVATNAYMPGTTPVGPTAKLVEQGGGDLSVRAGGDILGGTYYVQKGTAVLSADGSIKAGSRKVANDELRTVLAVGDARFDVSAGRDLEMETAFNPMLTEQNRNNWALRSIPSNLLSAQKSDQFSNFSTYSEDSAVHLTALTGDVLLSHKVDRLAAAGGADIDPKILGLSTQYKRLYAYQPGTFTAVALGGDVSTQNGFTMAPAARGQLELLAAKDVNLKASNVLPIVMLDTAAEKMSPYYASRLLELNGLTGAMTGDSRILNGRASGLAAHASGGLHRGDTQPVRIIALNGDINGDKQGLNALVLPKKAEIIAGRDIRDLGFNIQQLDAADVTRVVAGRDFIDSTVIASGSTPNPVMHTVAGPGRVDFIANRNFDLGNSSGVVTRGNLDNPYLPSGGASINILAGSSGAVYAGFARKHVAVGDLADVDRSAMVAYVLARRQDLTADVTPETAWEAFKQLAVADQNTFMDARKPAMNKIYFEKLDASSTLFKTAGLAQFDDQIASMFPTINSTGGDINLFASQLKTEQGGAIDLFAPGGSVYAGLANTPSYLKKPASNLGVFAVRDGAIRSQVKTDFLVNQGRVFTLGGGDVWLISQFGDLSAGKGSKTASSAQPPLMTTDKDGNTTLDIGASIAGSGIAALNTDITKPNGNIFVIAPRGTFDAGDAGVRGGSIILRAETILNAGNIVASGTITGAPAADTSALGGVAAPANTTTKLDDVTKDLNSQAAPAAGPSNALSVDVLGYGGSETAANPNDLPPTAAGSPAAPVNGKDGNRSESKNPKSGSADDERRKKK